MHRLFRRIPFHLDPGQPSLQHPQDEQRFRQLLAAPTRMRRLSVPVSAEAIHMLRQSVQISAETIRLLRLSVQISAEAIRMLRQLVQISGAATRMLRLGQHPDHS